MTCFTKLYNFLNSLRSAKHTEYICWYPLNKNDYRDTTEREDKQKISVKVSIDL